MLSSSLEEVTSSSPTKIQSPTSKLEAVATEINESPLEAVWTKEVLVLTSGPSRTNCEKGTLLRLKKLHDIAGTLPNPLFWL